MKRRLWGLCIPPILLCLLDTILTLLGQSREYWAGHYSNVNEGSPTFNHLLSVSPLAYIGGIALWIVVFVGLILLLPDTLALITSIAVTFGHSVGAATWILYRFHFSYQMCNGLFLLSAVVLGIGIRGWAAVPSQECRSRVWSPIVRWLLIASLTAAAVYLFLWPRTP